ncbi:hypothetical protein LOZ58_001687 [Ophidiomyces ophidiicola]|nr:hypothetical protein LOZ66_001209 [Ophidiomyces ophidiicola]KAI1964994.1 hypothetical protein LOZ58_001687 [Ophidiomyces ophidiicola]
MVHEHPGDRPQHPPVWVRGGPQSYYHPSRPQDASTAGASRRVSLPTMREAASPAASPSQPEAPIFNPPNSELPGTPGRLEVAGEALGSTPAALRPGLQEQQRSIPGASILRGQQKYAGLTYQKRTSLDEDARRRKASWSEQPVGSSPENSQWLARWWETFTKGDRYTPRNE